MNHRKSTYPVESFTPEEADALRPYVTNLDEPVFALTNLPEVVKGALFARYSRSAKSLRRLILDEFLGDLPKVSESDSANPSRAEALYERVFDQYGDDSVAQLGGVHLACEGVSNILTKVLERGRIMSYLEQSTRYVSYDQKIDGGWPYHVPEELEGSLRETYIHANDQAFEVYAGLIEPLQEHYKKLFPRSEGTPKGAYNRTICAKALDVLRGLLPAATRSNLGIYASGQAYEMLLLRMRASASTESRHFAGLILKELRKVIPSFMSRVDRPDRGDVWSRYLEEAETGTGRLADELLSGLGVEKADQVSLTDFDPEGEIKVVAAALYCAASQSDEQLMTIARNMSAEDRARVLEAYVANRLNRRHRPGRAFERTAYRFDLLLDYGAFRDLQRHRMLTLDWQALTPDHGYVVNEVVEETGRLDDWKRVMETSAEAYHRLKDNGHAGIASYVVPMAHRIRFYMDMNAREAMHIIELRSAPQGHAAYRRAAQEMHRLIEEKAGHQAIAAAIKYVNHDEVELERLEAETATENRLLQSASE